ncbi:hypothetical protein ES703_81733 [subsurface metagenome]
MKDAWRDKNGNVIRIAIYWQKEDVLETAKEMKIKLTDEEVSEVLETVLDSHDAMFGINNVFNMKVITLASAKGGVAKSASAISISYVLSQLGYKVLLIDADPQNAVTRHFVNDATQIEHKTLRQLFLKKQYIHDCLIPAYDGVDLLPGQLRLLNIEKELADENNPLFILHDVLIEVDNGYDFCVIDIAEVLDNIGIKKLRVLTAMKDKTVKYEILDRLITG